MQEYNWREERKKYRPDFRNEMDPAKEETPQQTAPPPPPPPANRSGIFIAVAAALAVVILIGLVVWFAKGGGSSGGAASRTGNRIVIDGTADTATLLAQAADRCKRAVGLVGLCVEYQDGDKVFVPIGTAWAFAPEKFATNSHVAMALRENARKAIQLSAAKKLPPIRNFEAQIVINGTNREIRPVTYIQVHRDYGLGNSQRNPDVAILTVSGRHDCCFKLAPRSALLGLKSGEPVAFLGFPMERLRKGNVHFDNPIASMQTGIIVAVSDFEMKDSGPDKNVFIRHNLPSAGGASGSPIFNRNGEVVAVLFGGNMIGQVVANKEGKLDVTRAPSAALIEFAIRVDELQGVVDPVPVQEFLR